MHKCVIIKALADVALHMAALLPGKPAQALEQGWRTRGHEAGCDHRVDQGALEPPAIHPTHAHMDITAVILGHQNLVCRKVVCSETAEAGCEMSGWKGCGCDLTCLTRASVSARFCSRECW